MLQRTEPAFATCHAMFVAEFVMRWCEVMGFVAVQEQNHSWDTSCATHIETHGAPKTTTCTKIIKAVATLAVVASALPHLPPLPLLFP